MSCRLTVATVTDGRRMAIGDVEVLLYMWTGLDRLLHDEKRLQHLRSSRVALLANPASMTSVSLGFQHALDALVTKLGNAVTAAFGPQHGMRGDKQYNMEESPTYLDPQYRIPVFSLYGEVRRPTDEMLDSFDVLLFDPQSDFNRLLKPVADGRPQ